MGYDDAAATALEQTPAVEKAHTCFQEGEKLINLRQKNILIADRSEHGWAMVAEYEEDNSDDEKRLFRAEVRAGRKIKQKSAKDAKKKAGPAKKPYRSSLWASPSPWSGEHAQST